MSIEFTIRKGSTNPTSGSGITLGEPAFNYSNNTLFIGKGYGVTAAWVGAGICGASGGIAAGLTYQIPTLGAVKDYFTAVSSNFLGTTAAYVASFNGLTGAVTGVASVNGSTGAVVTYVGTTGNIPYRYGAGVGITANSYFTLQSGQIGSPTDKLILSGATSAISPEWGNTEAIGLEIQRGYNGDGLANDDGINIVARGIRDDDGYLYGSTLRLTTPSSDEGGWIILAPQETEVVYVNSGAVYVYAPLTVSDITTTGNFSGTTGAFSKLLTASAGLSASGATFSGSFSGATASFSKLLTASAGVLTDSIAPLVGLGNSGTLYINSNDNGGGGETITLIGDWAGEANGTSILVDDLNGELTLSGSNIYVNGSLNASADILANSVRVGRGVFSGTTNTVLGLGAGAAGTIGANNIFVGYAAGDAVTTGSRNIAVGRDALGAGVTSSDCIAIGYNALLLNRGNNNLAVGNHALDALTTGINNVALGSSAGSALTTGSNNFALGSGALQVASTVSDNVAIGKDALVSKTTSGDGNVAIGTSALYRATTALTCTAVGYQSQFGSAAGTGQGNSSLGYNSLVSLSSASYNSAFGINALYALTSGNQNTACGLESLFAITTTGNNTGVGTAALRNITNGAGNVGIGHSAGRYKTASGTTDHTLSGDYNLYIGYQSRASGDSVTKEVVIGSLDALGLGSNTTVIGTSTTLGNRIFGVASTGQVAPTIASAATIAPTTSIVFVSGTTAVVTITAPSTIATTGGQITLIPSNISGFTTTTAGNIALASTAIQYKALIMTYDAGTAKWYPSY